MQIGGVLTLGISAFPPPVPLGLTSQVEYLVALISIIVGLGLADLAQSVRDLIRPDLSVKWDGLPLAWSGVTFTLTILIWWQGFGVLEEPGAGSGAGPVFLTFLLFFLLLYLCCAFALPDPDWKRFADRKRYSASSELEVDLEAFYFSPEHRRWFFGLLIGFWVMVGAANQFTFSSGDAAERLTAALPVMGTAALTHQHPKVV